MFKLAFQILKHIVSTHGPIWFINLDKATERYVRYGANRSGEFFSSTF
jgi:flavorubredoxin